MGKKDNVTKDYLSTVDVFADALQYAEQALHKEEKKSKIPQSFFLDCKRKIAVCANINDELGKQCLPNSKNVGGILFNEKRYIFSENEKKGGTGYSGMCKHKGRN